MMEYRNRFHSIIHKSGETKKILEEEGMNIRLLKRFHSLYPVNKTMMMMMMTTRRKRGR
jgi:hypothetical protein